MIGALRGKSQRLGSNSIIIFCQDVGYKVAVNTKIIEKIKEDKDLFIYIHTHVKDDCLELYGFLTGEDLFLFELLIEVSGVGPKTALLVLERSEKEIREAIISSDVEFFTTIPRIGRKNAQKIIIELKSKLGSLVELDLTGKTDGQTKEVIEALTIMGFKRAEVGQVLRQLPKELVTTEEKVKEALKRLGKR